ncbi:MAG TPA: hypothetical protein VK904_01235 [Miltoncostaeaceae bacterium]|nr:hypothetical protein [Miltoncostaeaceae bacterium]
MTSEGALRVLVLYETWAAWRDERRLEGLRPVPPAATHQFCAVCWGQGRIVGPAANGEGPIPIACLTCGGTGRVPAAPGD